MYLRQDANFGYQFEHHLYDKKAPNQKGIEVKLKCKARKSRVLYLVCICQLLYLSVNFACIVEASYMIIYKSVVYIIW